MPTLLERPSVLLTRMDMSDEENIKDAERELQRAGDDAAKLSVWAAKWGGVLTLRCAETEGWKHAPDEVETLTGELNSSEKALEAIQEAARVAIDGIDKALSDKGIADAVINAVNEAVGKLENAL